MARADAYPPLREYALLGDCHTAALVSRTGAIDWCCLPRFDSPSMFGRILDWERGGAWSMAPVSGATWTREYLPGTLVLSSMAAGGDGVVRLLDCMLLRRHPREPSPLSHPVLVRVVEGVEGSVEMATRIAPRPDYGHLQPWVRLHGARRASLIGADQGLVVASDVDLEPTADHAVRGMFTVDAGERVRIAARFHRPEELDGGGPEMPDGEELDCRLEETITWWREWSSVAGEVAEDAQRSAVTLKALTYLPTGAIVAAPTTSLPESLGGPRNWDYRYSWIRDSSFAVRSLIGLGYEEEADGFRRFAERSAAGSARELQVAYGIGGESRLAEAELSDLSGWRRRGPVRVGNRAYSQRQLDIFGELTEMAWRWAELGHRAGDAYWQFLTDVAGFLVKRWREPDRGLWEVRSEPKHFVHSKALCWSALDRIIRLGEQRGSDVPALWVAARDEVAQAVADQGYDDERGIFTAAFDEPHLDAALLRLPVSGFLDWGDPRMLRTTDAVASELDVDGLIRRYDYDDGNEGHEGAFIACTFWLVEALARQGRTERAWTAFERARATANDVGLFSEQFDAEHNEARGNTPQAMSHLAHIAARTALDDSRT